MKPELITIEVNDGNRMRCTFQKPPNESGRAILFSRGFVHDPEKEAAGVHNRHNDVMPSIEDILLNQFGLTIISVATNSYEPGVQGNLSLDRYINDTRKVVAELKPDGIFGYSIGGYVAMQVAQRERLAGHSVPRIAVLNSPLAPGEAVYSLRDVYTLLPSLSARLGLSIVNRQLCTAYKGRLRGTFDFISRMRQFSGQLGEVDVRGYATELVQEGLSASAVDIEGCLEGVELLAIIGEKDPVVFRDVFGFARKQTPEEYVARLQNTEADLQTLRLPIGHNLKPSRFQRLTSTLSDKHLTCAEDIAKALGVHFTREYAVTK